MSLSISSEPNKHKKEILLVRKCKDCPCVSKFIEIEFNGATRLIWESDKTYSDCPYLIKNKVHNWDKIRRLKIK